MTKITIDRAIVEQALEALEEYAPQHGRPDDMMVAITTLRAALAQQAEPVTEDMKSAVRWAPSSAYWSERLREFFGPDAREGIDALERRIAGVQEPVAWIHTDPDKPRVRFLEWREDEPGYRGRWVKTPLYLAPPQRKPLTEEEIVRIFETPELAGTHFQTPTLKAIAVARAIERAHGIGEQP